MMFTTHNLIILDTFWSCTVWFENCFEFSWKFLQLSYTKWSIFTIIHKYWNKCMLQQNEVGWCIFKTDIDYLHCMCFHFLFDSRWRNYQNILQLIDIEQYGERLVAEGETMDEAKICEQDFFFYFVFKSTVLNLIKNILWKRKENQLFWATVKSVKSNACVTNDATKLGNRCITWKFVEG